MIKYEDNSDSNFFTLLSLILCFSGLYIISFHYISYIFNDKNKDFNKNETFADNSKKEYALIEPSETSKGLN